jgi:hypothetical protein
MQTFGKRHYAIEFDPWATKKAVRKRERAPRERSIPTSRIAGYLLALVTVGVIAVASFEMLVLA